MKKYIYILGFLAVTALYSCDKDGVQELPTEKPSGAQVKFFNFGLNAPGVNYYANDTKLTAISSTTGAESTTGVAYGGAGNGGIYSNVAPGQYTFKGKIAAATDKDLAVFNLPFTVAAGKSYSVFMSGFYNTTTKTSDGFILDDQLPAIDTGKVMVRFVNTIPNGTGPMILYAVNQTTNVQTQIGDAVAYKGAGAFVGLPQGRYTFNVRYPATSTNLIQRIDVDMIKGRINTIASRGDITVSTTSTSANRPLLDNTQNNNGQ